MNLCSFSSLFSLCSNRDSTSTPYPILDPSQPITCGLNDDARTVWISSNSTRRSHGSSKAASTNNRVMGLLSFPEHQAFRTRGGPKCHSTRNTGEHIHI